MWGKKNSVKRVKETTGIEISESNKYDIMYNVIKQYTESNKIAQ